MSGRKLLREGLAQRPQLGVARGERNADLLCDPGSRHTAEGVGEDGVPAERYFCFRHAVAQALAGAGGYNYDRCGGTGL
ncbi:hypothetical protein NicSoilC12_13130 [Arthrobacter sp. NicSoilC12]|nr:hypothetical protein NicSoilC12_13130 [Arthrobacter sp. NicSoilC12]